MVIYNGIIKHYSYIVHNIVWIFPFIAGLFAGRVQIDVLSSGAFSTTKNAGKDRLKLTIPFAGQSIQWYVSFDARYPEIPPEFEFLDENFLTDIDVEILTERLHSLVNWNLASSPRKMLNVIQEFLVLYRTFQVHTY
jgi:BRCA1-A complex subunit BRE